MATLPLEMLLYAYRDNLITIEGVTNRQRLYLNSSVVTAADALELIARAGDQGYDYDQLSSHLAVSKNTARQYAKWLESVGLIEIEKQLSDGDNPRIIAILKIKIPVKP